MHSIGLVFKKTELIIVALHQGVRATYLEGHQIVPFLDFNESQKEEAILHNLERFLKIHKQGRDNLFIALPRNAAHVQFLKLPGSVEENLQATLGYEIDKYTPFPPDDIYFDYHVVQRIPEKNILNVLLIIIKKESIDYHLNLLSKINVRPRGIELTTTALYNMFRHTYTPHQTLPNLAWLRKSMPLWERYQSQLIKIVPGLAGLLVPQETTAGPPPMAVLFEYLHDSSYEIALVCGNILCHSRLCESRAGTPNEHFQEMYANGMRAAIHLPVDMGKDSGVRMLLSGKEMGRDYLEHLSEDLRPAFGIMRNDQIMFKKAEKAAPAHVLPLLSIPLGAALKGLKDQPLDINLIPAQRRPKKKRSKKKMVAAAVVIVMIALTGAAVARSMEKMKQHLMILDEQLLELKKQVQSIEELQKEAEKIEQFATALKDIKKTSISKLDILADITRIIPGDSWLTDFDYTADNNQVKISGYAVSASQLIPLLEESKLFADVKFTSPITTDKADKKEKFRIDMNIATGEAKP
jgi:Tfp pilus assembly PilM family ATPase